MRTEELKTSEYQSEKWRKRRSEIIARDGAKCKWCGHNGMDDNYLQVHHRQYHYVWKDGHSARRELWNYEDKYLVTLCEKCHKEGHTHYKVPVYDV